MRKEEICELPEIIFALALTPLLDTLEETRNHFEHRKNCCENSEIFQQSIKVEFLRNGSPAVRKRSDYKLEGRKAR